MRPVGVIILAAGKGTRMRSRLPKVAHPIAGRVMLEHAIRAAADAVAPSSASGDDESGDDGSDHRSRFVVVVGHASDTARAKVTWRPTSGSLTPITQQRQLGAGEHTFLGCDMPLHAPVTIGDGATIGSGSVVTRDVAPGVLVVGAPARVAPRVRSQGQMTPEASEVSGASPARDDQQAPASDSAGASGDTPNMMPTSPGGKRE